MMAPEPSEKPTPEPSEKSTPVPSEKPTPAPGAPPEPDTSAPKAEADGQHHTGRHEMDPHLARKRRFPRGSRAAFSVMAVVLCGLLGLAISTQVRQTETGDSLDTARPADLLVLLDSLQQREANLNKEIADLQQSLITMRASGTGDQAVIDETKKRVAALSIMIGTVGATGPGITMTIADPAQGMGPETLLDVIDELRAAGAEALEVRSGGQAVRIGVGSWVTGSPGQLAIDDVTLTSPYSVLAIGDPPTLAAAMNIPGGVVDTVARVGGSVTIEQPSRVDITALREPKPRQYAQPGN